MVILDKNLWTRGLHRFCREKPHFADLEIWACEKDDPVCFKLKLRSCWDLQEIAFPRSFCFWLKLVPSGVNHGSVLIPQPFMPVLSPLPPTTTLSRPLLPAQHVTKPRGSTKQAASTAVWSILRFCGLHEASGHGCWPRWLQPSCMCFGSTPWHSSGPIPWDGAKWGAPAILGKLVLHAFPHTVETDARGTHWLYSACCADLQPWPASPPSWEQRG